MGRFTSYLWSQFRQWEVTAQIAFVMAMMLLVPTIMIAFRAPDDIRPAATVGSVGLIIVAQGIFLWANRGMVTPFTKAQRLYLQGDFEGVRSILEVLHAQGKKTVHSLTLLGNTYRQLGQLDESYKVLLEALDKDPDHYFPLYGIGRTLMVQGDYIAAIQMFEKSLSSGGQAIALLDIAEGYYRLHDESQAKNWLQKVEDNELLEPHRALMAYFLRYFLENTSPPSSDLIQKGWEYWHTQAQLFAHTPYGKALQQDLDKWHSLT